MLGFGAGFGLFLSPHDVNRYMSDWVRVRGNYPAAEDTAVMILFYVPMLSVDVSPVRMLRLQAASELAWGYRLIAVPNETTDTRLFEFLRVSEVGTANLELPFDTAKKAYMFFGGGPSISYMKFEEHHATTPGARVQLGFALLEPNLRVDGLLAFDYIRARSERLYEPPIGPARPFELDYTSLHLDAIVHFDVAR